MAQGALQNKILSDGQYGFRKKKKSTYLALLEMTEEITNAIDNIKSFNWGVHRFEKAFDTVKHNLLI